MKILYNYKLIYVFLCILVLSSLNSCSDTYEEGSYAEAEEYYISLSAAHDFTVNPEGGSLSLSVGTPNSINWNMSDLPSWINASSRWGAGNSNVTLDVLENPSFTESRIAVLHISANGGNQWSVSRPITISQNPRSKKLEMSSETGSFSYSYSSRSVTLSISSNIEWEIASDASFVTFSKKSGIGDATITMYVAAYSSDDAVNREANISLMEKSTRNVFQRATVKQSAKGVTRHTDNVDFTDAGGSISKTNLGNTVEGFTASSDASWLTVTPTSGTGSIGITMKADANTTTSNRTATVTVNIKGSSTPFYVFYVTQAAKSVTFTLSENSHSFGCYKAETYPKITSNVAWKAESSDESWLTVSPTSGTGDATLTVSATSDNPNTNSRKGTISFTYDGQTKTYNVTQASAGITLSNDLFTFDADGGSKYLVISGTGSWTITKDVTWLTLNKTYGNDAEDIKLTASKNTSTSSRFGNVTIKSQNGITHTARIEQKGATADYITISPEKVHFDAKGNNTTTRMIDVSASGTWTAITDASWVTIYKYSTYINVWAAVNNSSAPRTAYITFTCGTATATAEITQEGAVLKENGHEYVDLGLPSGLKWATCNIGASVPEQIGNYYAWGETETKTSYYSSTYVYYSGGYTKYTYWYESSSGTPDKKATLDLSDDAARKNWGGRWRMPTKEEAEELLSNCTHTNTTINGVKVQKITGSNGNYIIMPYNSRMFGTMLQDSPSCAWVWTSSHYQGSNYKNSEAWTLNGDHLYDYLRYDGFPIRPVFK